MADDIEMSCVQLLGYHQKSFGTYGSTEVLAPTSSSAEGAEPPDSYWAPDGGAREGGACEKNWGCFRPCQATRRGSGASTGSEKLRAAEIFFRDRVVSSSQKNTKIDQIS